MYLDTLLSIFVLMAKLKVLFIVSNIRDNQSLKLSRCFPINIRGSRAQRLLPIISVFYKFSMCAHILVNLRVFWVLQSTPHRCRSGDDDLLRSLSCLQFHMRGWGGFWTSPITGFYRKCPHNSSYWSILGCMGYHNVFLTLQSYT